jgi:ELWxxDGT repeat protein
MKESRMMRACGWCRWIGLATAAVVTLGAPLARAQAPYLVKDINPGFGTFQDADASNFAAAGGLLFLKGCDAYHGCELWKSDGTEAGTAMVKDIAAGSASGLGPRFDSPGPHLTNVTGTLFFVAEDGTPFGRGLWKSDGTAAGTLELTRAPDLRDTELAGVGVTLFFVSYGDLWKSDGTTAGTVHVKSIDFVGPPYSRLSGLTAVNRVLFFFAPDGALWRSDGTTAGTVKILDPGPGPGIFYARGATASVRGTFFFIADDGVHGVELWKSDGTTAGTVMVRDIRPGAAGTPIESLTAVGGTLFFVADDGVHGKELWRSDGTESGTVLVRDIVPGAGWSAPSWLTSVAGTLFFVAADAPHGFELWRSDGTGGGTVLVRDLNPGPEDSGAYWLTDVNGTLFFVAYDGVHATALWKSDGTTSGTVLVTEVPAGYSYLVHLTNLAEALFFEVSGSTFGGWLWKSDGTPAGTVAVEDIGRIALGSLIESITSLGGKLLFLASDGATSGLFRSDGTGSGTTLVKSVSYQSWQAELIPANGLVFFVGRDDAHGFELWKSDGTEAGTGLVKDLLPGPPGSYPEELTSVNGTLFFALRPPSATELWKSDGTSAGTVMVKRFYRDEDGNQIPNDLTNLNGTLFLVADDGSHGPELWKSDGTAAGTVMVKDIRPGAMGSFQASLFPGRTLTRVSATLFFGADDGTHGPELWKTDGTPEGTVMVKDIVPGEPGSAPQNLTNVDGTLFFSLYLGGNSLWKSDGAEAGTVPVKTLPGALGLPDQFTSVNGALYFDVDDGMHGHEVWRSDGTEAGTVLLKDINPDTGSSYVQLPSDLTDVNGTLFFAAFDGVHGRELWKSDGTEEGTVLVRDLNPGTVDSSPGALLATPAGLYFVADDGVAGRELWALTSPALTNDDGLVIVQPGQALTYRVAVTNPGGPSLVGVVTSAFPASLQGVTWTCTRTRGAACAASGAGDIDDTVELPGGSSLSYLATGTVSATATGILSSTATLTLPYDPGTRSATDVDVLQAPSNFFTLTPCRLVDTRGPGAVLGGQAVQGGETRVFVAAGHCGIPATAKAISANVTVLRSGAPGHVRIFPAGQALPTIATVNYQAGQVRASNAIVALNANGEFAASAMQGSGTTVDLVVDVTGYFE